MSKTLNRILNNKEPTKGDEEVEPMQIGAVEEEERDGDGEHHCNEEDAAPTAKKVVRDHSTNEAAADLQTHTNK